MARPGCDLWSVWIVANPAEGQLPGEGASLRFSFKGGMAVIIPILWVAVKKPFWAGVWGRGINSTRVVPPVNLMLHSCDMGCKLGDAGTGAHHVLVWIVA